MSKARAVALGFLCGVLGSSTIYAADLSSYRGLRFGMNVSTAAMETAAKPAEVRVVHLRPALIQEMDWQPRVSPRLSDPANADPMQEGLLCFFNGELFRIVVTYDRYKVEGMTAEDMIEAVSVSYGAPTRPAAVQIAYRTNYGESGDVLARWEDADYSYNLVRTGDRTSFALAAIAEAVRLDVQNAPQRELEKKRERENEERLVLDRARSVNKPNFRP